MGITRFITTLKKHKVMSTKPLDITPNTTHLMIDYNANIHYILQKVISELNEILIYLYSANDNDTNSLYQFSDVNTDLLSMNIEQIEDLIDYYDENYKLGDTYELVSDKLSSPDKVFDVIHHEVIKYTRQLVSSINTGYIKYIYFALDGVPSNAKVNEQRNRRYVGAILEREKKEILKKYTDYNVLRLDLFDYRTNICPGSKMMTRLETEIFNLGFENVKIEVSTSTIRGEGEKKIIHKLKEISDQLNNSAVTIMSPDSDMFILLAILKTQLSNVKFYNFRIDHFNKNAYEFYDIIDMINSFREYYATIYNYEYTLTDMIHAFFMFYVFGNDFMPNTEPLDIREDFDKIFEIVSKINVPFEIDNKLNYQYIIEFYTHLIEPTYYQTAVRNKYLNEYFSNYKQMVKSLSIEEKNDYMHPDLQQFVIDHTNITEKSQIVYRRFRTFADSFRQSYVTDADVDWYIKRMHDTPESSYFASVLPKCIHFEKSKEIQSMSYLDAMRTIIKYMNTCNNPKSIKIKTILFVRNYQNPNLNSLTPYIREIEKLNNSLEPYRSKFGIKPVYLTELAGDEFIDLHNVYYKTYADGVNPLDIVSNYCMGIEWLYKYYIQNQHLEYSSWYYPYNIAPLISDIITYLSNSENIELFQSKLVSMPDFSMDPSDLYLYVTPNDYTGNLNTSPSIDDVKNLIDGTGAPYLNKCRVKWYMYKYSHKNKIDE